MADSSVRVQGPLNVQSDSKYRVAFELMEKIAGYDDTHSDARNREYWLTLYAQSLACVKGDPVKSILQSQQPSR